MKGVYSFSFSPRAFLIFIVLLTISSVMWVTPSAWATTYSYSYWCFNGSVDSSQFTANQIAAVLSAPQPSVIVQGLVVNNCPMTIRLLSATIHVYDQSGLDLGYAYVNGLPLDLLAGTTTPFSATITSFYPVSTLRHYHGQVITVKGSPTICLPTWFGCFGPFTIPVQIQQQI